MARRRGAVRAKLGRMSARAKKLLLMRIYLYAIASGNTRLLKFFGATGHRKGRRSRRRRKHSRRHRKMSKKALYRMRLRNLKKARAARRRRR